MTRIEKISIFFGFKHVEVSHPILHVGSTSKYYVNSIIFWRSCYKSEIL